MIKTNLISLKYGACCLILFSWLSCVLNNSTNRETKSFELIENAESETISMFRNGGKDLMLTQNAKLGMRPYLHPIMAPDGNGALTEYSPGHHKHQTGLYWGFTRVNGSGAPRDTLKKWFYNRNKPQRIKDQVGRDFFHFNGETHWKKIGSKILVPNGEKVSWQTVYHMLDASGEAMLEETMQWSATEVENKILLDLEWKGKALRDMLFNEFSYGGMFLRMPWKKGIAGAAINSSSQKNEEAEGQKAKWVDVGMEIEGRSDWGHIAIFDHPKNENFPTPWRVDGQLGIGPCRAIEGDWQIKKGEMEVFRFSIVAYTGDMDQVELDSLWEKLQDN